MYRVTSLVSLVPRPETATSLVYRTVPQDCRVMPLASSELTVHQDYRGVQSYVPSIIIPTSLVYRTVHQDYRVTSLVYRTVHQDYKRCTKSKHIELTLYSQSSYQVRTYYDYRHFQLNGLHKCNPMHSLSESQRGICDFHVLAHHMVVSCLP